MTESSQERVEIENEQKKDVQQSVFHHLNCCRACAQCLNAESAGFGFVKAFKQLQDPQPLAQIQRVKHLEITSFASLRSRSAFAILAAETTTGCMLFCVKPKKGNLMDMCSIVFHYMVSLRRYAEVQNNPWAPG